MKPEPLYYIPALNNEPGEAGPYDLVQLAGLLRRKIISSETPTLLKGQQEWIPFGNRPQYIVAKEMSPDAVSRRMEILDLEARTSNAPIPLPSTEFLIQLGALALVSLLVAIGVFFVARADITCGVILLAIGAGMALIGTALMYARMTDEDYLTLIMIFLVPLYDIYYFLANLDAYWPYFAAKYAGGIVAAAALAGIAANHSPEAASIKTYLGL